MYRFSFKIAFSIIAAGLFIIVCFAALNYENLTNTFYIISGLLVVFIVLFGFAMGGTYSFPLKQLLKKAESINRGDLKSKLNLKTKDETEELSHTFNKITESIEKNTSEMEDFKKSSDIKFKTKDIVTEKIIDALEEKIKNRTSDLERSMIEVERLKEQLLQKDKELLNLKIKPVRKAKTKKIESI